MTSPIVDALRRDTADNEVLSLPEPNGNRDASPE